MWTLIEACHPVRGRLVGADIRFDSVATDSRGDCAGQLFVALRGDRFDAHDFVATAARNGAVAALVERALDIDLPQLVVADTRIALGELAAAWRDRFPGRIVAITGSNGKTTCKELVASILSRVGSVVATRGNLNNDIGMPLTLLGARDEQFLVLEMGANHPGEIAYLTRIVRPDVALLNNAGRAHLEGFGSLEGVARAKGEIAGSLPHEGIFVFPSDTVWSSMWRDLAGPRRVLTFGFDPAADLSADAGSIKARWDQGGFLTAFDTRIDGARQRLGIRLAGRHNVRNALAAAAAAAALGIDGAAVRDGLDAVRPVPGRLSPRQALSGARIIDDTYNANPDSVEAAIDVLMGVPGRRWLVLGDLGELGTHAVELHRELGNTARVAGVDRLAVVGDLSAAAADGFGSAAKHYTQQAQLIDDLRTHLTADDVLLIKGSRLSAMDRVVVALCGEKRTKYAALPD